MSDEPELDPLIQIQFWMQVVTDARRTVICTPDLESRVKGYIAAHGLGGLLTVKASPFCPDGRIFIIDQNAIDAATAQAMTAPRIWPKP